ncbi:MAG TPA: DUF1573 domain-containing protein [Thermoguttaceae bacterium]|nr:DUF1573 domain-containing protein [Thermoguttaceae bacterium]
MLRKIACTLLLTLLTGSTLCAQEWARKMFETTTHEFGSVARDAKVEHEFVLKNIYLEDIHVASVRSSCGCTTPRITKEWLKTYEKGAIVAHFNTDSFLGSKGATLTVTIDKPFYAEVQLHVSGNIRSDVVFNPGSVQLGSIDEGDAADQRVTVSHTGSSNWKIIAAKSANPHISVGVADQRRSGGRVSYDLVVHLDENAPAGYVSDQLMLTTNNGGTTQIPLLIEGRVVPSVTVSPASLFMGVVSSGKTVTKQLVVRGKKPFRILDITCDDESFEFGVPMDDTPKLVHLVPVTFVAGKGTGKVSKTIRIQTDLGEMVPKLEAYAVVAAP